MNRYLIVLFVFLLSASICCAQSPTYDRETFGPIRYTTVVAKVVGINPLNFPYTRLTLNVTRSTNSRVLNPRTLPRIISADSYFWRTVGRVDCLDSRNIGSIAAYYLLQGDEINAKLFTGSASGKQWFIYGIQRAGAYRPRFALESIKVYGNLQLALDTRNEAYNPGQGVPVTLTVRNTGTVARTLNFRSSRRYDFVVTQAGKEIWRWSAGKMFAQMLGTLKVEPGETLKYTETWNQVDDRGRRVPPGEYKVTATLTAEGSDKLAVGPVTVTVLPTQPSADYNETR